MLGAACACLLLAIAPAAAAPAGARCSPPRTVQLLANSKGRVYQYKRSRTIVACLLTSGRRTMLDYPPDEVAYPLPAIDLTGYYVAYALEDNSDPNGRADTILQIRDLRTGATPLAFEPGGVYATGRPNRYDAKVGSVRVRPNGSLAWIACRQRDNIREEWGDPRPSCVRPGGTDEVRIISAGEPSATTLEVSRGIDPRSLRLKDGRISWKSHARIRAAPLP